MGLAPGTVFAGFTIEATLGFGGMGTVYRARHPRLPRSDALKLLRPELSYDPDFAVRFAREADIAARLNHPNIVGVNDRGEVDGQLWISMPYIEGTDAEQALAQCGGPMAAPRAVQIIAEIAAALDFAHRSGLWHRDVKPANILLTPSHDDEPERALLTDFGIAKAADEGRGLTKAGSVIATFDYAPREQIDGKTFDHRVDIYALGGVLYKLLTGTVPYPGATMAAALHGHLNLPPPRPTTRTPWLSPALDEVIARAMAKDPDHRYPSCRALATAARAALTDLPTPPPPPYTLSATRTDPTTDTTTALAPLHTHDLPPTDGDRITHLIATTRFFDLPPTLPPPTTDPDTNTQGKHRDTAADTDLVTIAVIATGRSCAVSYHPATTPHPTALDDLLATLERHRTWRPGPDSAGDRESSVPDPSTAPVTVIDQRRTPSPYEPRVDPLPTGTVTMLFSDIESSTVLLSQLGDRYGEAVSVQRRIMRAALEASAGQEIGTDGDGFFVAFESASDALTACLRAQRQLVVATWPGNEPVRVRMGLHTGEPTRHEDGYVGMDVNRGARIAATAHGGQVVVSDVTAQLAGLRLPDGVRLADLGWHRLKDIDEPEHIFQLVAPDLPGDFPPLKSLGAQTSLPPPATPLIGREDELRDLHAVVSRPGTRVVTLTGPGGVGKTRLALALATALDTSYRDGVYFVPLATVTSAEVMWKVLAESVGANTATSADRAVAQHLAARRALLVLDNLEQLAEAAGVIATLLAAARKLVVIATSRRPLHLRGECEYHVPPLTAPASPALADVAASAAAGLFVQQAALVRRSFTLTAANAGDVAAICRRLDGLPLAIELAASRVKLLPPRALLARLDDSLDLAATDIDRPSRQQTMRATVAWSHQLLSPDQERVFRRMAVFASGCDLDAIASVTVDRAAAPPEVIDPLQAITDLLDCSLVTVTETPEGDNRLGMLETIRDYTHEQLSRAGELEATRRRHAAYYTEFAEQAKAELRGPRQLVWLDRLETEHDNLRSALAWTLGVDIAASAIDQERTALGMRLVDALRAFWFGHSHAVEGRRWLELAIDRAPADGGPVLSGLLHSLGWLRLMQGEAEEAQAPLEQALVLRRKLGDPRMVSAGLMSLGVANRYLGRLDVARALTEESVQIARGHDAAAMTSAALTNLAQLAMDMGDPDEAMVLATEAAELVAGMDQTWNFASSRLMLAAALMRTGHPEQGNELMCTLIEDIMRIGHLGLITQALDEFTEAAAALGADHRAARLAGAGDRLREQTGIPRPPPGTRHLERALRAARQRLGHEAWKAEYGTGRQLTRRELVALAKSAAPAPE